MLEMREHVTEDIEKKMHQLIDQAYRRGYDAGIVDGSKSVKNWNECERKLRIDEAIEKGRQEAWEAAKKIANDLPFEIFGLKHGSIMSSPLNLDETMTASEAIEKIHAFEEKKEEEDSEHKAFESCDECVNSNDPEAKCVMRGCIHAIKTKDCFERKKDDESEICVGDEVIWNGHEMNMIVCCILYKCENGSVNYNNRYYEVIDSSGETHSIHETQVKKTGRHFSQISEVLKKLNDIATNTPEDE